MFVLRAVPGGEWSLAHGGQISPPSGSSGSWGRKQLSMKLEVNRTEVKENAAGKWLWKQFSALISCGNTSYLPSQLSSSQQRCGGLRGVQTPSKDCSCYQMFFQLLWVIYVLLSVRGQLMLPSFFYFFIPLIFFPLKTETIACFLHFLSLNSESPCPSCSEPNVLDDSPSLATEGSLSRYSVNTTCLSVCVLGNEPFPTSPVSSPHLLSLSPSLSLVAHWYSGLQVKGVATHLQFSALIAGTFEEATGKGKENAAASGTAVCLASLGFSPSLAIASKAWERLSTRH